MDVLVYTSDILDEDVEVTGPVELMLYAASDAVDTDFHANPARRHLRVSHLPVGDNQRIF
jgi:uncharacterized protein